MDTEKQRQRRRDDARLTESGKARSEQLAKYSTGAYRVANQPSLACLSGSERRRPGWFLDMKYQTCFCGSSGKNMHDEVGVGTGSHVVMKGVSGRG